MQHLRSFARGGAVLTALAAMLSLGACTDLTNPNGTVQSAAGYYVLATVNGATPPATVQTSSGATTVRSDIYTLNSDGTYSEQANYTTQLNGTSNSYVMNESGYWTQSSNAIVFTPTYNSQAGGALNNYTGALSTGGILGNNVSLTVSGNGIVEVFARQ